MGACDSARAATALKSIVHQYPDLAPFHTDAIGAIANRLAITVSAIRFYGEVIANQ